MNLAGAAAPPGSAHDRTREFELDAAAAGGEARIVLCAVLGTVARPGQPARITTPAGVVMEAWEAVTRPRALHVQARANRLLAAFEAADTALDVARQLAGNLVFPDELCARFGLHAGIVDISGAGLEGRVLDVVERLTRIANPGWIVATRPIYDRLGYVDQLNLYSLDQVAFGADAAPLELLKVAEESDYLRSSAARVPWGPYRRMVVRWGENEVILEADSPPLTIGRGRANRLRTDDAYVSVEHARIVHREREFLLLDSSTNGTFCAARGEPHFKVPPSLRLRKPGILWFGRPPSDTSGQNLSFYFE